MNYKAQSRFSVNVFMYFCFIMASYIFAGGVIYSYASTTTNQQASLTGTINNATLTFNTGELPANSTITSATLNLTGNDTSNGVEVFEIRVLANGQIAGRAVKF